MQVLEGLCEHLGDLLLDVSRFRLKLLVFLVNGSDLFFDDFLLHFQSVVVVVSARTGDRVGLLDVHHRVVIHLACFGLLDFFDDALAAECIAAAVAEEFVRLVMLPTNPKLFRNLVDCDLLVLAEEGRVDLAVMEILKAIIAEILLVVLTVNCRLLVAVLLAHDRVYFVSDIDHKFCLDLMQ